ncbi:hypothetical protein MPLA_180092 [Mesorhizobium sp. ORS 3359]|nr:hypothetical protein MPLA_180092 [Mesorhizobium sp. ORS 3359]
MLARYCMMAQLSHSTPRGRLLSSIIGVRCAGLRARNSGERVWPQASVSAGSSPAARANTLTVMLLTLGLSMLSFMLGFLAGFAFAFAVTLGAAFAVTFAAVFAAAFGAALAADFFALLVAVFAILVLPLT